MISDNNQLLKVSAIIFHGLLSNQNHYLSGLHLGASEDNIRLHANDLSRIAIMFAKVLIEKTQNEKP